MTAQHCNVHLYIAMCTATLQCAPLPNRDYSSYRNDQQDATMQDNLLFSCSLTAQHCNVHLYIAMCTSTLQYTPLHCNVHRYIAMCTSTLQCAPLHCNVHLYWREITVLIEMTNKMQLCRTIYYSIIPWLLNIALCTYTLQCAPIHCNVHLYIAMCTSTRREITVLIQMTNKMQLCRTIYYSVVPWLLNIAMCTSTEERL